MKTNPTHRSQAIPAARQTITHLQIHHLITHQQVPMMILHLTVLQRVHQMTHHQRQVIIPLRARIQHLMITHLQVIQTAISQQIRQVRSLQLIPQRQNKTDATSTRFFAFITPGKST